MRLPSPAQSADGGESRRRRLIVVSPRAHVQALPEVFEALLGSGTELVFCGQGVKNIQRTIERFADPLTSAVKLPLRRSAADAPAVKRFRTLSDLAFLLNPELRDAGWARTRAAYRFLTASGYPADHATVESITQRELPATAFGNLFEMFERLERSIPPEPALVEAIDALEVDGIFMVSRCSLDGADPDVIKVARRLGLPTVMLVFSWDNLSSKAVLHEHPDHLLVWNETQAWEATCFHGVPPERVQVVGAPNFDRFFGEVEGWASQPDAAHHGRRTILYLGSSKASRDEPTIFSRWLEAVRSAGDAALRDAQVVVRPHPGGGGDIWEKWAPPEDQRLSIESPHKGEAGLLARSLRQADAVVALSTSAEIEAAIAGRPVVTFRAGDDAPAQEDALHFHYLLEQRGGFVIDARDLDEHVAKLARVLDGDYDPEALRGFVERFVRPAGLERPVAPIVASTVLELVSSHAPQAATVR
jgi:hypothetical protein